MSRPSGGRSSRKVQAGPTVPAARARRRILRARTSRKGRSQLGREFDGVNLAMKVTVLKLFACASLARAVAGATVRKARADVVSVDGSISGYVDFEETSDLTVAVSASITGLAAGSYGFHVHEYGDIRESIADHVGSHFVPVCQNVSSVQCAKDTTHGLPPSEYRMAGDMGNIVSTGSGAAVYSETLGQDKMSLNDTRKSILGRALAIHQFEDTGGDLADSGPIMAAGVIRKVAPDAGDTNVATPIENTNGGPSEASYLMCVFGPDWNTLYPKGDQVYGELLIKPASTFSHDAKLYMRVENVPNGDYEVRFLEYESDSGGVALAGENPRSVDVTASNSMILFQEEYPRTTKLDSYSGKTVYLMKAGTSEVTAKCALGMFDLGGDDGFVDVSAGSSSSKGDGMSREAVVAVSTVVSVFAVFAIGFLVHRYVPHKTELAKNADVEDPNVQMSSMRTG